MKHQSLWFDTDEPPARYPALEGERRVDVAVVGAGITGMTAALLLARAGRSGRSSTRSRPRTSAPTITSPTPGGYTSDRRTCTLRPA